MRTLFFFLISLSLFTNCISQTELKGWGKINPKDDAATDKSFSEFYAELKNAVESKDAEYVYGIVSPEIEINHYEPDQNNKAFFQSKYDLKDPSNEFWTTAKKLLSMGASRQNFGTDVFYYPHVAFVDDYNTILGDEYYLNLKSNENYANAVSDKVPVYKDTVENSEILGNLNNEIVKITNFDYDKYTPWYKIELKDGSSGYVRNKDLYLGIFDYLMGFKKVDRKWKLDMFQRSGV